MNKITKTFSYGGRNVVLETGQVARQATGSVMIRVDDTVILVAVVGKKEAEEGRDFFPLTVNYQEKYYAAGRIPGGYFKREGRPTEKETLISRLIDRPIRPLFPKGFSNDVQIVATVLSQDPDVPTDIPAIIGASAALAISGIPFDGPLAAARVGFNDEKGYMLNPSLPELATSRLDLVVAGTKNAVLMVESEAQELTEEQMLGAVLFGHEHMQVVIQAINEFAEEVGTTRWDWQAPAANTSLEEKIAATVLNDLTLAYQISDKGERQNRIKELREKTMKTLTVDQDDSALKNEMVKLFHELEAKIVRNRILDGHPRIDGRDTKTVRPISIELGVLPRTHGSALFTRGETQALVVTTLGTERDAQMIDDLDGDRKDEFMLHYNFPPYSVGETGMMAGPKRREIGHGKLAKRAVGGLLPHVDDFPYTIRIVSEITESNGSSSMATVCGSSLALMDAGVPIKAAVSGIAMGLIKEADKYAVLTDILGDEDHLGDMDFKVAGTNDGVTALQMDIKIQGITKEIMEVALAQAKEARIHILNVMNTSIREPRSNTSAFAPRITSFKINPDKIREVIGKGGATIRDITESTNTTIDISDDGIIKIAAFSRVDSDAAKARIEGLVAEVEVGQIYEGPVVKLVDFGAFVSLLPGQQGLLHISQIAQERVENVHDYLKEGQTIKVKVIEIDRQGRVRLSMKDLAEINSN